MTGAIDVHTHFVPRDIPQNSARNPLWPSILHRDGDAAVMVGGKVFRVIDSRSWDAARRIDDMGKDGIAMQVLSPMPELLSHWFPANDADALAQHINAEIAALCAAHSSRFIGIGMVPMQDPALAAKRIADIKALGLRGIEIGSHIDGVALGDPRFDDFYATAEEAGLAIMTHPLHPAGLDRIGGRPELAAIAAFPLETAFAATSLMTHGVTARFPKLRILLSHGGGALPWIVPRLRHGYSLGGSFATLFPSDPATLAQSFTYDSIVYGADALRFLAERIGVERIVVGSDYPFAIKQDRPAAFAESALGVNADILINNARTFLGM